MRHPRQRLRQSQSLPVVHQWTAESSFSTAEGDDEESFSASSISMTSDDDRPLTFDVDESTTDSSFSMDGMMGNRPPGPMGFNRVHPCDHGHDGVPCTERLTATTVAESKSKRRRRKRPDWVRHSHSASDAFECHPVSMGKGGGGGSSYDDKGGNKEDEETTWSITTAQLLQGVKAILFTLWVFLSLITVVYLHYFDGGGGTVVVRDVSAFGGVRGAGGASAVTGIVADAARRAAVGDAVGGGTAIRPYVRAPPVLPPLLRPTAPRNHIPLPLPPNKVSIVLMNFSRPRMIQESTLMRTLLSHPNVDEIILLHSNPNTAFRFVHPKVINVDATQQNDEMGLSLRFYFCQMAKNDWVIHVDDDMEFTLGTLSELLIEFARNTRRLVGRFGRNVVHGNSFNGYSSASTHKQTEVVLTKLMVMERMTCSAFFEYSHLIWEDTVLNNGEGPLWNGEDIFMSLVANHVYGNDGKENNYAMDWLDVWNAREELKDYDNGKLDISGGMSGYRLWDWHWWQSLLRRNRHYSYRGKLWKTARKRLAESGPFGGAADA